MPLPEHILRHSALTDNSIVVAASGQPFLVVLDRRGECTMGKRKNPYTKETMIVYLKEMQAKQEKRLSKKDVPEPERSYCHALFGKWLYALEEAGIIIPSEETLAKRAAHKAKWKKKHREMSYWRSAAGKAERAKLEEEKMKKEIKPCQGQEE